MRHQTLEGAAGVVRNIFDHPVCSALERGLSLLVAATPPLEEGNCSCLRFHHALYAFASLSRPEASRPLAMSIFVELYFSGAEFVNALAIAC